MWERRYRSRIVTAEEAIMRIQPNQSIFIAPLSNEPQTLVEEVVQQKKRIQKAQIYTMIQGSQCLYGKSECLPYFKIRTFLSSPLLQAAYQNGDCDYIPMNMSKIPNWFMEQEMDHVLIQVTPPDENGFCCLGVSVDFTKTAIKTGKHIIAEVNSELPWVYGDSTIHVDEIDLFVHSSRAILEMKSRPLTEIERQIGENVAELIPNYANIQIGVGNIADSVLKSLKDKKDLGMHTGTFTDEIIDLVESGVITNQYKNMFKGKIIATSIYGTRKLYDYVNRNSLFELYPVEVTHNIQNLSRIDKLYAINSALEVDLSGQINAEQVGGYPIAGVGGQMDFIKGAQASVGGKSIIALPATAKKGTLSRITNKVLHVTTLKSEIDYVVTEYGIASLAGKSLKQRMDEMIAIAHPNFRKELKTGAVLV